MVEKEYERLRKERTVNSSLDEMKKDIGRDSPQDSLHLASESISTVSLSTSDAEVSLALLKSVQFESILLLCRKQLGTRMRVLSA